MDITAVLMLLIIIVIVALVLSGIRVIEPYRQGIYIRLGKFIRVLNPGFNLVVPLISQVQIVDLRTQAIDAAYREINTKDNSTVVVKGVIFIKVIDAEKAYFEVPDYLKATSAASQKSLESIIGQMDLDQVIASKGTIKGRLKYALEENVKGWGVMIDGIEINEIEIISTVHITAKSIE